MYLEPSKDHCGRSEREEGWEESVLVLFLTFCETVSEIERLREGDRERDREREGGRGGEDIGDVQYV